MQTQELIADIVVWLSDYIRNAGLDKWIVGVSGGLDSAAAERLCERTGRTVCCVAMPMSVHRDSNDDSLQKAMSLCVGRPNVEFHIRPIGDIVAAYQKAGIANNENPLFSGNLRSRIRANILYDFAGQHRGLVVGTGNRDEDDIGYFTKGGDGLVDICPVSMIHKSQVNRIAIEENVPEKIISAVPTAGLWDGQTDEQELGMTYTEIEWALKWDDPPTVLDEGNRKLNVDPKLIPRERAVLSKVRKMKLRNQHKLELPPIYVPKDRKLQQLLASRDTGGS